MAGFFRGTSHEQDARFKNKHEKMMNSMKFPPEYSLKVKMSKVKLEVIKPWISQRISQVLGMEDDVVVGLCYALLETGEELDPRDIQIQLQGFMAREAKGFVTQLWAMLHSASQNPSGIPTAMLEQKKKELMSKKADRERIEDEVRKKRDQLQQARRDRPASRNFESAAEFEARTKPHLEAAAEQTKETPTAAKEEETVKQEKQEERGYPRKEEEEERRGGRRDREDRGRDRRDRSRERRHRSRSRERRRRSRSRDRGRDRDRRGRRSPSPKRQNSPSPEPQLVQHGSDSEERRSKKKKKRSRKRSDSEGSDSEDREAELRKRALGSVKGNRSRSP